MSRSPASRNSLPERDFSGVSSAELVFTLQQHRLLAAAQLEELTGKLQHRFTDPRALAKELLRRNWLTPYQVNQLLHGQGGNLVLGPYVLLERLGEGGIGQVFKARHQTLHRVVALKLIRKELLADSEVVNRFYREIRAISQLTHAHLVHALDAGPIDSTHVLVMEYVDGIALDRLVKQSGPLPVRQACDYILQATLGLQHIHERGLVHRDIKPSNLLVSGRVVSGEKGNTPLTPTHYLALATHQVKILDLGLARFCHKGDGLTMTPAGPMTMGTADYMAPEQAIDFHQADIRADIYSLGCTFYFLLTGQPPFPEGSLAQKLLSHQQREPPRIDSIRADVSAPIAAVLHKMLAKNPDDRFQTPGEVAAELSVLLSNAPQSVPSGPASGWVQTWRRAASALISRRRLLCGSALLLLATAIGLLLLHWSDRGLDKQATTLATSPAAKADTGRKTVDLPKTVELPREVLFRLDFEDGKLPALCRGCKVVRGPDRPGNDFCLEAETLTYGAKVALKDGGSICTFAEGLQLVFDLWVDDRVSTVDLFLWNRTLQDSQGLSTALRVPRQRWIEGIRVPFADFKNQGNTGPKPGDVIGSITIHGRGGTFYIDNLQIVRAPLPPAPPRGPMK
jgi:serine/threonine-protein kinase